MNEDEKLNCYLELYDISKKIIDLNPFDYFNELDIITILLPHFEEPFYCNVVGKNSEEKVFSFTMAFRQLITF